MIWFYAPVRWWRRIQRQPAINVDALNIIVEDMVSHRTEVMREDIATIGKEITDIRAELRNIAKEIAIIEQIDRMYQWKQTKNKAR